MIEEDILKIFYEEIVLEINLDNQEKIGNTFYQFPFFINQGSEEYPNLMISNKMEFDSLLVEYIKKYYSLYESKEAFIRVGYFCSKSNQIHDIIKYYLSVLWLNMTEEDFKDPNSYLKRRISFLEHYEELRNFKIDAVLDQEKDYKIESSVSMQLPSMETAYYFSSIIYHDNEQLEREEYVLPKISFGITDDKAYVYSIQTDNYLNKKEEKTAFEKKINRYLYKANEGVLERENDEYLEYKNRESAYYPENISDVTVASLFSLTLFFELLDYLEIKTVECIPFLPLRYASKVKSLEKKEEIFDSLYKALNIGKEKNSADVEAYDRTQANIVDKFIRTFRRYAYHFPNVEVVSYPYEVGSSLLLKNQGEKQVSNHILNQMVETVEIKNEKERSR